MYGQTIFEVTVSATYIQAMGRNWVSKFSVDTKDAILMASKDEELGTVFPIISPFTSFTALHG